MAYAAGEWKVNVRGNLAGSEIWSNSWCLIDPTGVQDIQEAGDILHAFYEDIAGFASWLGASWNTVGASAKALNTGLVQELVWATETGSSASEPLPQQLAIRISLQSAFARGGPFLSGFTTNAIGSTAGSVDAALIGDFVGALETMTASLTTAGWQLGLDQPTTLTATQVTGGRIGNRWDVIRKRANDVHDTYTSFAVA